jgi:hypothetical protein
LVLLPRFILSSYTTLQPRFHHDVWVKGVRNMVFAAAKYVGHALLCAINISASSAFCFLADS